MSSQAITTTRPSRTEAREMIESQKEKLRFMLGCEKYIKSNVHGILTSTGCRHSCSFCCVSCPTFENGEVISIETISEAKEKIGVSKRVFLTGGEPLDHPKIVELTRLFWATVDITNGFSDVTHPASEWQGILEKVGSGIKEISFPKSDRFQGNSPGRDAVIKFFIERHHVPGIRLISEFGKEKETVVAWLETVSRILTDEKIKSGLGSPDPAVTMGVFELPFINLGSIIPMSIAKTGKGKNLNGLETEGVAISNYFYEHYAKGRSFTPCDDLYLLPNGDLVSIFLHCYSSMPLEEAVVGSIALGAENTRKNLVERIKEHLSKLLNRSEEEWDANIETCYKNHENSYAAALAFVLLFKDQEVLEIFRRIKNQLISAGVQDRFKLVSDFTPEEVERIIADNVEHCKNAKLWPPAVSSR